jgi:ribonuclease HI
MSKFMNIVKVFTDGGSRGNPGPGAIGVVILDEQNNEIEKFKGCIGYTTNNRAEYRALIKGLDLAAKYTRDTVHCHLDSELVAKQMLGLWRLKKDELRVLFHEAKDKERAFKKVTYTPVRRTNPNIRKADKLVNEAFEGR